MACFLSDVPVIGQENGNGNDNTIPSSPVELTKEAIQKRINSLDESNLDESTRKEIETLFKDALNELSTEQSFAEKISELKSIQKNGSERIETYNQKLSELQSAPDLSIPDQSSIDQLFKELEKTDVVIPPDPELSFLEQESKDRKAKLDSVQSSLKEVTETLDKSKTRRENNQSLLNEAQGQLDEVTSKLKAINIPDAPNERAVAELVLLHARKKKLETQIELLKLEKQTYEQRRDLLLAEERFLKEKKSRLEKAVQLWQMVVSQNMERKAKEDLEETEETLQTVKDTVPFIEKKAEEVKELATERIADDGPIRGSQKVTERLKSTKSIRESIENDLSNVKDRIRAAGLTHRLGSILRQKKEELPAVTGHQSDISELEQQLSDAQIRLIELNEMKSNLIQNKEDSISSSIKNLDEDVSDARRNEVRSKLTELYNRQLGLIEKLIEEYDRYFAQLTDLLAEKRKLVGVLTEYRTYINERVIWIRSTSNFFYREATDEKQPSISGCQSRDDLDANMLELPQAVRCFFQLSHWKKTAVVLFNDLKSSYILNPLALLLLIALLWYRSRYFQFLTEAGQGTFSRFEDSFLKTSNALLYTVLITLPVPGLLFFAGWRLQQASSLSSFPHATGLALIGAGLYSFTLSGLRHTCHPEGLGRHHFRWSKENIQKIRTNIVYILYPTVPLVFLFVLSNHLDNQIYRDTIGRLFFIMTALMVAWFVQRILSPAHGIVSNYLEEKRGGWIDRMRYIWYPLIIGMPLALGILAALGYYYTARQLMYRLSLSFVAFLSLLYFIEVFVRWQIYKNIEFAIQKREERREERSEEEEDPGESEEDGMESFSLPSVNEQTEQLLWSFFWVGLVVGFWWIWADVLPALGMLNEVELWTHPQQVLETVTGEEGQSVQRSIEQQVPVTLADVLLGMLILVMMVVVSKNLPGLMEITVLQNLPMDPALRYAYKTMSRYVIVLVGIVGAAVMFGIRWGDIQWLVAGVSVGLGFGLQEIFANFVSGIILLFERPIRVGDTITVNEVTGKVTRIRTRATTIQDLDRKELIVPNRDFIQGELVNWTLSDSIMRVVIPIGVAYGSDTELVEKKLMEITRQEKIVLDDPEPNVIFTEFGDNALKFSLRFFIEDYENYWKAFHKVNQAVDKSFKEAGITIAFPQRDLHLKSVDDDVSISFSADDIPAPPDEDSDETSDDES